MTWVAVAAMAVGAAVSVAGAKKGEKAAKKQGAIQAESERNVTQERLYQLGLEEREALGSTMAGYASGGVQLFDPTLGDGPVTPSSVSQTETPYRYVKGQKRYLEAGMTNRLNTQYRQADVANTTSTPLLMLAEQTRAFQHERRITEQVGATQVAQIKQAAGATADRYRYQGYANVAGSIANIFSYGKQTGW